MLISTTLLWADKRDLKQLQAIAAQELQHANFVMPGATVSVTSDTSGKSARRAVSQSMLLQHSDSLISIMTDGRQSVIMSMDDAFPAVLGVVNGNINETSMSDGLRWWLNAQRESMATVLSGKASIPEVTIPQDIAADSQLAPGDTLVTSLWGQGAPYCNMIPYDYTLAHTESLLTSLTDQTTFSRETPSAPGCTATALAMICRYWQYPKAVNYTVPANEINMVVAAELKDYSQHPLFYIGNPNVDDDLAALQAKANEVGDLAFIRKWNGLNIYAPKSNVISTSSASLPLVQETSVAFDIDYAKMLDSYTADASAAQKLEVAKLMYACTMMMKPDLSDVMDGSKAASYIMAPLLQSRLGFAAGARFVRRLLYTSQEWTDKILNELAHCRPILYSAADAAGNEGHAFVLDGYRTSAAGAPLFHFNFGWNGSDNSWLDISNILAEGTNYCGRQGMTVGISPSTFTDDERYADKQERLVCNTDMITYEYDSDDLPVIRFRGTLTNYDQKNTTGGDLYVNVNDAAGKTIDSAKLSGYDSIEDNMGLKLNVNLPPRHYANGDYTLGFCLRHADGADEVVYGSQSISTYDVFKTYNCAFSTTADGVTVDGMEYLYGMIMQIIMSDNKATIGHLDISNHDGGSTASLSSAIFDSTFVKGDKLTICWGSNGFSNGETRTDRLTLFDATHQQVLATVDVVKGKAGELIYTLTDERPVLLQLTTTQNYPQGYSADITAWRGSLTPDGIITIDCDSPSVGSAHKYLDSGTIVIRRNDRTYLLDGRETEQKPRP